MNNSPKICISHLKKSFQGKSVLEDISFDVQEGESLVILGGSGSGKSVTLKCILGLIKPDAGNILIDNQDMCGASKKVQSTLLNQIGMLFQGAALFDSLPVWENIAFSLIYNAGMSRAQAKELAIDKLAQVGLDASNALKYPAELSGGMQKRVGLARAIATQPKILFFDEPTAGLDPIMCHVIDDLITRCVKKLGATTITITHDLRSARRIADKIALLHNGRLIWTGAANELDTTDNPYVRAFVEGRPLQSKIS